MKENKNLKRLQIFLKPETEEMLTRLADLNGCTVSVLVRSLFQSLEPGIRSTIQMIEASRKLDQKAREKLATTLETHALNVTKASELAMETVNNELQNL